MIFVLKMLSLIFLTSRIAHNEWDRCLNTEKKLFQLLLYVPSLIKERLFTELKIKNKFLLIQICSLCFYSKYCLLKSEEFFYRHRKRYHEHIIKFAHNRICIFLQKQKFSKQTIKICSYQKIYIFFTKLEFFKAYKKNCSKHCIKHLFTLHIF